MTAGHFHTKGLDMTQEQKLHDARMALLAGWAQGRRLGEYQQTELDAVLLQIDRVAHRAVEVFYPVPVTSVTKPDLKQIVWTRENVRGYMFRRKFKRNCVKVTEGGEIYEHPKFRHEWVKCAWTMDELLIELNSKLSGYGTKWDAYKDQD